MRIQANDHTIELTHPDKVMYPDDGFTKADVVDYYRRIAPILLPHLEDRPLTMKRFIQGTGGKSFFEKQAPPGMPNWVQTANVATPGSTKGRDATEFVIVDQAATLAWLAQLGTLELHVPQWKLRDNHDPETRRPDRLVFDLDPGKGAGFSECVRVARLLRDRLTADSLTAYPKSSGKKGLHVSCPIAGTQPHTDASDYAKGLARDLEGEYPGLVTSKMYVSERTEKVFIDWSQNNAAKTTISLYSLRNLGHPTVSTPMTWNELESGATGGFTPAQVLERVAEHGDLSMSLLEPGPRVPD